MIDGYAKGVLTVIAASLALLAIGQFTQKAGAQLGGCGNSSYSPCYVEVSTSFPLRMQTPNVLDVRVQK